MAFVDVVFVNTPVDAVVAPIGVPSIVLPESVRTLETFASERAPVIDPKEANASVTLAFPSVPELTAEALIEPVASMVRPFTTIASLTEPAGRERLPVTARFVEVVLVPVAFVQ